jgi:hypothetical protein
MQNDWSDMQHACPRAVTWHEGRQAIHSRSSRASAVGRMSNDQRPCQSASSIRNHGAITQSSRPPASRIFCPHPSSRWSTRQVALAWCFHIKRIAHLSPFASVLHRFAAFLPKATRYYTRLFASGICSPSGFRKRPVLETLLVILFIICSACRYMPLE